jgi:hypothetical protein
MILNVKNKTRQLLNGEVITELQEPINLNVYTKCPEKYMLIDMETGQKYIGYSTVGKSCWKKVEVDEYSS